MHRETLLEMQVGGKLHGQDKKRSGPVLAIQNNTEQRNEKGNGVVTGALNGDTKPRRREQLVTEPGTDTCTQQNLWLLRK